ncbi:MAG: T9SS type A sorting domain-containing protein [Calditrichaceae bacterium]|nr:T9SS type A sorting domain-containing protein [Calditrichia bacterium]NUQ42480.1 T9SS type A sorting domain-containing protein [Calditrichaceae bacterium]
MKWTTQSEVNNLGFEVYRSGEETGAYAMIASFENTPALQGGGNSNTAREYTYEDAILSNGGTYWYQIADVDYQGVRTFHGPVSAQAPDLIPEAYALRPNYPNPFNPETTIRFEVPADPASNGKIALAIYNNLGMVVRTLVSGSVQPGIHTVKWDGRNDRGDQMASGVYFLRLQAGSFVQTQKMLLVR